MDYLHMQWIPAIVSETTIQEDIRMNASAKLKITKREKASKGAMHQLRRDGLLPCSISRKGSDAVSFSVRKDEFRKALFANGVSSIYTLQMDKANVFTAMVREIQYIPGSEEFQHITFQAVSLTEETTADIPVHVKGREELIHNGLELLQQLESIHLKGLPADFPAAVEVDVSGMQAGDHITVADLQLPKGIASVTEDDRLVLSVAHPKLRKDEAADEADETAADDTQATADSGEAAAGSDA